MSIELHKLTNDANFPRIVEVEHKGYDKPFNAFWEILKGPSVEECAERQLSWHKADPTNHWFYVADSATKEVLGGMNWSIYDSNPYANGPPVLPAYWWPEGELKEIADQLLSGFFNGRPSRMAEPHLLISYCFVHPDHRHRGVASLLMNWGTSKADELGLPVFVESTEDGKGFYEAHGFRVFEDFYLGASVDEPSAKFVELTKQLQLPAHGYYMKREPNVN